MKENFRKIKYVLLILVLGILLGGCSNQANLEQQNILDKETFEKQILLAEYEQCMNFEAARLQALASLDSSETGLLRDLSRTTARARLNSASFKSYAIDVCREFRP